MIASCSSSSMSSMRTSVLQQRRGEPALLQLSQQLILGQSLVRVLELNGFRNRHGLRRELGSKVRSHCFCGINSRGEVSIDLIFHEFSSLFSTTIDRGPVVF